MARQTLRDVIDQVIARAWDAGAETALMWAGYDALEAERLVRSGHDPVWRADREDSVRRQQRLSREQILAAIESAVVAAVEQAKLPVGHEGMNGT